LSLFLKGWKKASSDKHTTTLRHANGHEMTVMHSALSPKHRASLAALDIVAHHEDAKQSKGDEYAKGGKVEPSPSPKPKKSVRQGVEDFEKGMNSSGWQPEQWIKNAKEALGMAQGGKVRTEDAETPQDRVVDPNMQWEPLPESEEIEQDATPKPKNMYSGGDVFEDNSITGRLTQYGDEVSRNIRAQANMDPNTGEALPPPVEPGEMSQQQKAEMAALPSLDDPQTVANIAAGQMTEPQAQPPADQAMTAQASVPQDASQQQAQASALPPGVEMQKAGIQKQANAESAQARAEADILQKQLDVQQEAERAYHKRFSELDMERQQFQQDIADQHIDPNRYLSSQNTGQRIASTIGLLLSGIGSGMAHQENAALKFMNDQIDRDIKAQALELGKKENLLSANMKQFGNLDQAMTMTRLMQNDIVVNQLKRAAAQSNDPAAQARAMQAIGVLTENSRKEQAAMTMKLTINDAVNQARKDPSKAQDIINVIQNVDPKRAEQLQKTLIPGVGFAASEKDATDVKESKAGLDNATQGIKRLLEINKVTGKSLSPSLRAEAKTLQQTLVGLLRLPITGPGAMNEGERKMLEGIIANPTNLFALDSSNKVRLQTLQKKLESGYNNLLKSKGLIPADPTANMTPDQKRLVQWAKANPNDHKAQIYLRKLGIQ